MSELPEAYLGDGVYASCDGWHIILELRKQSTYHRIALEPPVMDRLLKYRDDLLALAEQRREKAETG